VLLDQVPQFPTYTEGFLAALETLDLTPPSESESETPIATDADEEGRP
jgi:hypothetical protein